jgi:hypothetical protein
MSPTVEIHRARILRMARRLRATDRQTAWGRCLEMSLQFAERAQAAVPTELHLVRWRVLEDSDFCEHWAVWLDEDTVIDLTRVQVDGQHQVAGPVSDYPANYVAPRRYPARLLLVDHANATSSVRPGVLRSRYLMSLARRMLRHDLLAAGAQRSGGQAWQAACGYGRFVWWLTVRDLRMTLADRFATLTQRLNTQPDYATRTAPLADSAAAASPVGPARPDAAIARVAPRRR